jgi:hypothetical protein
MNSQMLWIVLRQGLQGRSYVIIVGISSAMRELGKSFLN